MNYKIVKTKKYYSLFAGVLGIFLVNLPSALAIPTKRVNSTNPCPGIYYEEPYNSRLVVPRKCVPNVATIRWLKGKPVSKQPFLELSEGTLVADKEVKPIEFSVAESRERAIAVVNPREGKVNVKLKNDTNTPIVYQVIEHTEKRSISAQEEITLQDLPTPVTITMRRRDGGFITVTPKSKISEEAILNLSLDESKEVDDNQGALRIKRDGQVFLN